MIQSVPHSYTSDALLLEINTYGTMDSFDMLYLPGGVKNRSTVGYAFINFSDPDDATKFSRAMSGHRWGLTKTKKCCKIAVARVQGISANLALFVRSSEEHGTREDHEPIVFSNGRRLEFMEAVQMHCAAEVFFEFRRKRAMSVWDGGDVGCLPNHMPLFARTSSEKKDQFIEASSATTAAPFDDWRHEITLPELCHHWEYEEQSPRPEGPFSPFRISL